VARLRDATIVRFSKRLIASAVFALCLALGAAGAAPAQAAQAQTPEKPFSSQVAAWTKALEHADAELSNPQLTDAEFAAVRGRIETVLNEAQLAWHDADVEAEATDKLLAALGPAPKEGEPPETEDVAKQRAALKAQLADAQSRMKQADLIVTRASAIRGRFITASGERLAGQLLVRGPSPLLPSVWAKAVPEFVTIFTGLVAVPLQWLASGTYIERGVYSLAILIAGLVVAVLVGWPLRTWLLRRFGRDPMAMQPSMLRRLVGAAVEGVARGLLPSLAVAAVYLTFLSLELFSAHLARIASGLCLGLVFFILVSSLSRAALAPHMPRWQLAPLDPENAKIISRMITALAGVAAGIIFLHESVSDAQLSVEFKTAFNFVTNSMVAAGMLFLLRRELWRFRPAAAGAAAQAAPEGKLPGELLKVRRRVLPVLRVVMMLVAVTIPVSGLLGYYNLSAYLTSNLAWSAALVGGLWLLHELLREVTELLLVRDEKLAPKVRRALTVSERGGRVLEFWLLFGINLVLIVGGIAFALPIWGVSWGDLSGWLKSSQAGIYFERLTFSLSDIATAFLVFAGILIVTRWLQRALDERIFPQTRLDIGVRHSLKAAVGYVGLVLAIVAGISALGLDLTNLALVAGALSVGIGFGLQAIASNFVSGLILLIERPIKVGDWVRVGDKEGFVRRISVRATELETFQRANIIVPNSEILSTAVVNLTHKDHFGRIDIPIGVAYGSDVEKVKEVLQKVAAAHPEVVKSPPPAALLLNFGDSSLDFQLRVHVDRIERYWTIVSDLHYAIEKAFRENGITIPFPQRDLHLPGLDKLQAGLAARASAGGDGETVPASPDEAAPPRGLGAKKGVG